MKELDNRFKSLTFRAYRLSQPKANHKLLKPEDAVLVQTPQGEVRRTRDINFQEEYAFDEGHRYHIGASYSFTAQDKVFRFATPAKNFDDKASVLYSTDDPSCHKICGIEPTPIAYHLSVESIHERRIFSLLAAGDWQGVEAVIDHVVKTRPVLESQIVASWFRPDVMIESLDSFILAQSDALTPVLQAIADGAPPMPALNLERMRQAALREKNALYLGFAYFVHAHWAKGQNSLSILASATVGTEAIKAINGQLIRHENSLLLKGVKALWEGIELSPYAKLPRAS